ncbi:MAG: four helix bundle protein [Bacteroidia bacterium 44-10]|nr:MAG: four helix bundle protein [Bacteroidia bacterium 44-10]
MFRSLIVWQKGHQLVLDVYRITKSFPEEEKFGIVPQIRRAVISITANISEGYRKVGKKDKLRFFYMSQGSLAEMSNFIIIAKDLQYISKEDYGLLNDKIGEVDRLLESYCAKISKDVHS